jgi:serine/threonine protein kinase
MPLQDAFHRNPLQKRANDAILENLNLAAPPSRKDLAFTMTRALEVAPATQVLQWRSSDGSAYQLRVSYKGDIPTWVMLKPDDEPPAVLWQMVTEDPEQIYRMLLKKSTPGNPMVTATGNHAAFVSNNTGQHGVYIAPGEAPANDHVTTGAVFLNRYNVTAQIAKGGMGVVYKAFDQIMNREVAIKVLHAHLTDDDVAKQRFEKEMQACINFKHPNVVSVFDYGYAAKDPYMVMEFCSGQTLESFLKKVGTLDVLSFIKIFNQICSALTYAHEKDIIHRDVKPRNIILAEQPGDEFLVKLLDFGIAKGANQGNTLQKLTHTGDAVGSPFYMSPEQCRSGAILDARSDIYSLGCVMYEAICGRVPFNGQNALTTFMMHLNDRATPFSILRPDLQIPATLEKIILRTLEKNPANRYQKARELSDDLVEFERAYREAMVAQGSKSNQSTFNQQSGFALQSEDGTSDQGDTGTRAPSAVSLRVLALLELGGLITSEDVEAALKLQLWHGGDATQYLVELGCIDTRTHRSANQCLDLMDQFSLSAEDAALTLRYCQKKGITIEEALAELG